MACVARYLCKCMPMCHSQLNTSLMHTFNAIHANDWHAQCTTRECKVLP
jgi:hypothetical protein